jgi:hypothetical protein
LIPRSRLRLYRRTNDVKSFSPRAGIRGFDTAAALGCAITDSLTVKQRTASYALIVTRRNLYTNLPSDTIKARCYPEAPAASQAAVGSPNLGRAGSEAIRFAYLDDQPEARVGRPTPVAPVPCVDTLVLESDSLNCIDCRLRDIVSIYRGELVRLLNRREVFEQITMDE